MQVAAYDQDNGIFASRLWWLLRWLGHDGRRRGGRRIQEVDHWKDIRPTSGVERRTPTTFAAATRGDMVATAETWPRGSARPTGASWTPATGTLRGEVESSIGWPATSHGHESTSSNRTWMTAERFGRPRHCRAQFRHTLGGPARIT